MTANETTKTPKDLGNRRYRMIAQNAINTHRNGRVANIAIKPNAIIAAIIAINPTNNVQIVFILP